MMAEKTGVVQTINANSDGNTVKVDLVHKSHVRHHLHDIDYATGGNATDRKNADLRFRTRIKERGHVVIAEIYYSMVRTFGRFFFNYDEGAAPEDNNTESTVEDWPGISPSVFTGDIDTGDVGNMA